MDCLGPRSGRTIGNLNGVDAFAVYHLCWSTVLEGRASPVPTRVIAGRGVGHTVMDPGVRRFEIDPEWPHGYQNRSGRREEEKQ
jgi:hypothetical protein